MPYGDIGVLMNKARVAEAARGLIPTGASQGDSREIYRSVSIPRSRIEGQ